MGTGEVSWADLTQHHTERKRRLQATRNQRGRASLISLAGKQLIGLVLTPMALLQWFIPIHIKLPSADESTPGAGGSFLSRSQRGLALFV